MEPAEEVKTAAIRSIAAAWPVVSESSGAGTRPGIFPAHALQDCGGGLIIDGARQWTNYWDFAGIVVEGGRFAGPSVRVRGLRRFYAAALRFSVRFEIVHVFDDCRTVLAAVPLHWQPGENIPVSISVEGGRISARAGHAFLTAEDKQAHRQAEPVSWLPTEL